MICALRGDPAAEKVAGADNVLDYVWLVFGLLAHGQGYASFYLYPMENYVASNEYNLNIGYQKCTYNLVWNSPFLDNKIT